MTPYPKLPAITIEPGSMPTIIIDKAEQDPLPISFATSIEHLTTGDYSYKGGEMTFRVERKSIADLTTCIGVDRDRFERQLDRMRAYQYPRLLIVGDASDFINGRYRSRLDPAKGLSSLRAFEARYIPIWWESTAESAARRVELWAYWHYREMHKAVGRV